MPAFVPSLDLKIEVVDFLERAQRQFESYGAAVQDGAADGLLDAAYEIFDLSQVYVPRDTEALADSGRVEEVSTQAVMGRKRAAGGRYAPKSDTVGFQVVYGGPGSGTNPKTGKPVEAYAVIVHEDLEATHAPPTQAKFLERAVNEVSSSMTTQVGEGVVRAGQGDPAMNQARLYDGVNASGTEIALVRLTTQRRKALTSVPPGKGTGSWSMVLPYGDSGLSLRVMAEGHFNPGWVATLYDRQELGSTDSYFVAMAAGDSHGGQFMVEALDELAPAQDHRTFRLVLLSTGAVTYTPA